LLILSSHNSFLGLRCLPQMSAAESALFIDRIPTSYLERSWPTRVHSRTWESFTRCPFLCLRHSLPHLIHRISLAAFLWVFDWFSLPVLRKSPAIKPVRIRQFVAWDTESFQISWIIHQIQITTMFAGFESLDNCSADDMMLLHEPLGQTDFTYPLSHLTSVKQEKVIEGLFCRTEWRRGDGRCDAEIGRQGDSWSIA